MSRDVSTITSARSYRDWWESAWSEREALFKTVFGETSPPGKVISFNWDDFELRIPGACALVFPPAQGHRHEWLTISHGLSQPLEPPQPGRTDIPSGYGYEFGFLTNAKETWCHQALWQLMTYLKQSGNNIDRGHRVPIWFSLKQESSYIVTLGKYQSDATVQPFGDMRAVVFWPYMAHPAGFDTSTGYFSVLLGSIRPVNHILRFWGAR